MLQTLDVLLFPSLPVAFVMLQRIGAALYDLGHAFAKSVPDVLESRTAALVLDGIVQERGDLTTAYQRFFTVMRRLPPDWAHEFATVDYERRLALVAERLTDHAPELIGVARYEPSGESDTAEIALVVEDAWQDRGLGVTLLGDLLAAAEARGIRRFVAYVLGDNHRMLGLLTRHTNVGERSVESGVVTLILGRKAGAECEESPGGGPPKREDAGAHRA